MNRRDFFGRMAGILCGAAVAPRLLEATELPRAAALTGPRSIVPATFDSVVLTNEVIARAALEMLRRNLAFVKAERITGVFGPVKRGDALIIRPSAVLRPYRVVSFADPVTRCNLEAAFVEMATTDDDLIGRRNTREYLERTLEPAMYALAETIGKNLIGSRGLYCADQSIPDHVEGVRAFGDDFSLRMMHHVDINGVTNTRFDVLYGVDRGRK